MQAEVKQFLRNEGGGGGVAVFLNMPKRLKLADGPLKLRVLIFIQSGQDKVFSCLLFTVLFTIISIISSTILKLRMG